MEKKDNQKCVYIGEDLNVLYDGEEETIPETDQSTDEMSKRLKKNLIDEGYLELVTRQ